jgi:heme-degrading monooxygenase HmoA
MFYCGLSSGNKSAIWLGNGVLFGSILGTLERLKKEAETKPDFLEVIEYKVEKSRMKEFEKYWNDSAKRSQTQRGYGWTRMYKSIAWEESPFNYLSMRLWEEKPVEDTIFNSKLSDSHIVDGQNNTRRQYVTVVDDSVVRTIA